MEFIYDASTLTIAAFPFGDTVDSPLRGESSVSTFFLIRSAIEAQNKLIE
jgi:hypothetical protein